MTLEEQYSIATERTKIKKLGQYFTPKKIADFMAKWVSVHAKSVLDPAVGNGVFIDSIKKIKSNCTFSGYEIDSGILKFFNVNCDYKIKITDYLLSDWESKYDAVICNPPYNKFQSIDNRELVRENFNSNIDSKISGYTNQYVLFLIKSIYQLNEKGRLAYIIPSEFLNSKYGNDIKKFLINKSLLKAIINLKNNGDIFFNATTTCCILLVDKIEKNCAEFISINNIDEIEDLNADGEQLSDKSIFVNYNDLVNSPKWLNFINNDYIEKYNNLIPLRYLCKVSRGIATGDNSFFVFSKSKIEKTRIPEKYFSFCVCKSADITVPVFCKHNLDGLIAKDKSFYLLNIKDIEHPNVAEYINYGEHKGTNKRYLTQHRSPWYCMEQKPTAPIWITSANRSGIKVVRNIAEILNLTTFHSLYLKDSFNDFTDILFCYLLTPIAQKIIRINRKEMGNGLDKFQPNDLNTANILNLSLLTDEDCFQIKDIYKCMQIDYNTSQIVKLETIFLKYLS